MRAHGATDIEGTDGSIVAGVWTDFDPLTPLKLVAAETPRVDISHTLA